MRTLLPVSLALVAAACVNENTLSSEPEEPSKFDTSSDWEAPVDTSEDDTDTDSGGGVIVTPTCDDDAELLQTAAYDIAQRTDCEAPPPTTPDWTLSYKWKDATIGMMLSTVAVGHLTDDDGDGTYGSSGDTPDVVATPYSGKVVAYNGDDGSTIWSTSSSQIEQSTPAIGDLDGDGIPEVVVFGLYASFALHGNDGSAYWTGNGPSSIKTYCGSVNIADLDADGDPEVFSGRQILDGQTGRTRGTGSLGNATAISGESPQSLAADIDLDGDQEVIVGNAAYDASGTTIYSSGGGDGFPAVGNFDADPEAEIVVAQQGKVILYEHDFTKIWETSIGSGGYFGPPAVADFDGDGDPEIAVPVAPGVVMLDSDGTQVWKYPGTSSTFFDGVSAYDLDGDGVWEVLHVGNDGVHILNGPDGALLSSLAAAQSYCGQMPVVADMDGDLHVDIAFGTYNSGVFVMEDAANAFTAGFQYWNQHAFSITNIDTDMSIPAYPTPNWSAGYNNFRAGPPVEAVFPDTNLIGKVQAVCVDECDAGNITFSWSVGNDGLTDITDPVGVEIWGHYQDGTDHLLYSTTWTASVRAGKMEASNTYEAVGLAEGLQTLSIRLDGGADSTVSQIMECDESDNEDTLGLGCVN